MTRYTITAQPIGERGVIGFEDDTPPIEVSGGVLRDVLIALEGALEPYLQPTAAEYTAWDLTMLVEEKS